MLNKIVVACTSALVFGSSAFAGTASGLVESYSIREGLFYFKILNATLQQRPACAVNTTYWIIKDEKSTTGRQQIATVMSAFAAGKHIYVTGANTCSKLVNGEDIYEIWTY